MEKTEKETHDFMNVESFSQLPFIRPAPPVKEKGIRLFGKEFGTSTTDNSFTIADESNSVETNNNDNQSGKAGAQDNGESNRKFECHYCCRNFPTSQALGGHQNAHKRERQHAKRAHLQSAMAHGSLSEAHAYGYMNYRLGSGSGSGSSPVMAYQSWSHSNGNNAYTSNNRFYGSSSHGSSSFSPTTTPINGSPLGLWRIPQVHTSSSANLYRPSSLFTGSTGDEFKPASLTGSSSTSQNRFVYESKQPTLQDHVSLDLRL